MGTHNKKDKLKKGKCHEKAGINYKAMKNKNYINQENQGNFTEDLALGQRLKLGYNLDLQRQVRGIPEEEDLE